LSSSSSSSLFGPVTREYALVPLCAGRAWHHEAAAPLVTLYELVLVVVWVVEVTGGDVGGGARVVGTAVIAGTSTWQFAFTVPPGEAWRARAGVVRVVRGAATRARVLTGIGITGTQLKFTSCSGIWQLTDTGITRSLWHAVSSIKARSRRTGVRFWFLGVTVFADPAWVTLAGIGRVVGYTLSIHTRFVSTWVGLLLAIDALIHVWTLARELVSIRHALTTVLTGVRAARRR